jgi:uracil-DNA glycosylase
MSEDRVAAMAAIADQVRVCTLCDLYKGTTNAVPGAGNVQAEIMFIGEGPGFHEDKQGLPFVGRSGDLLTKLLGMIGLKREEVFITNVVKHRPPDNRDPLPNEMQACKPYLDQQIALIDPLVIVTLGRFSMARYFPGGKITQIHGQAKYEDGRAYYPLYHPAAVLRADGLRPVMEADFQKIPSIVQEVKTRRASAPAAPETPSEPDEPPTPPKQLTLF